MILYTYTQLRIDLSKSLTFILCIADYKCDDFCYRLHAFVPDIKFFMNHCKFWTNNDVFFTQGKPYFILYYLQEK